MNQSKCKWCGGSGKFIYDVVPEECEACNGSGQDLEHIKQEVLKVARRERRQ